jgi:predicted PurR-regulated permease PerM
MDPRHGADLDAAPAVEPTSIRGLAATVVFATAALYVLRESREFAAPVLVSVLIAYALEPLVEAFMRCHLPRAAAVVVTYLLIVTAIAGAARLAKPQAAAFFDDLPNTVAAIKDAMLGDDTKSREPAKPSALENLQRAATSLEGTIDRAAPPPRNGATRVAVSAAFDLRRYLLSVWTSLVGTGAQLVAIAVLTFVLLLGGHRIKAKLVELAGPRFDRRILTLDVIRVIDRQIQRYLLARLAISIIVAAATAGAMWWLGIQQPLALGIIAGVLNTLPFVGPAIGVALCAVVAFVQFRTVVAPLGAGAAASLVAALEGNLITPWLTSRAGELNTVAVFVSVLFWGWMWDVWGLLLAVPIMIAIKAAADHIEPLRPVAELLGR